MTDLIQAGAIEIRPITIEEFRSQVPEIPAEARYLNLISDFSSSPLPAWPEDGDERGRRACAVAVENAGKFITKFAEAKRRVKDHYEPYCKAAHTLHRSLTGLRDEHLNAIEAADAAARDFVLRINRAEQAWRRAEELRIQREAQAKADAERRAAEEKAREERRRIEQEAMERAAAEAEAGRIEAANAIIEEAAVVSAEVEAEPIPVVVAPQVIIPQAVKATAGMQQGSTIAKVYSAECVDKLALIQAAAKNPDVYAHLLSVDQSVLNAFAKGQKESFNIPGCKLVITDSLRARR